LINLKKENHKRLATILRIIIGIALIALLIWRLDLRKILDNIRGIETIYLFYAGIPYFLFIVVSAWRWQVLLDYKKFNISFGRALVIYFIATFFNNFLPTTIGGDVMRVLYSMKDRRADALATVLVDRILGFVGLFIFALFAVLYLFIIKQQTEFLPFIIAGLIIISVITYLLFSRRAYGKLAPVIKKIKILKLGERLNRLYEAAIDFNGAWYAIALCIVLSILIQAFLALGPFFVMKGMSLSNSVDILPFFIYIPIINVVSMIPISFNALGVREYFYVLLFSRVGFTAETSVVISLVAFFIYFLLSLVGGLFFIFVRKK
jgi:uncharacterized protein (TIRG00374 family)